MKFYKRNPDAALAGMAELTLEQRGAYNTIIDLLYSHDDILPDNDEAMARVLNCQVRRWQRLKAELIAACKIRVDATGLIHANRVTETIKEAVEFSFRQQVRVAKRWINYQKANGNNEASIRRGNTTYTHSKNTSTSLEVQQAGDCGKGVAEKDDDNFGVVKPQAAPSKPAVPVSDELTTIIRRKQQFDKDWR